MIVKLPTLGLVCPFPLVEAKEAMAKLNKGDGLEIEFDCTQATEAIPAGRLKKVMKSQTSNKLMMRNGQLQ